MAFALKIIGNTKDGREVEIAPSWWNIKELRRTYNFNDTGNQQYRDYHLSVDKPAFQEMIASQEKYKDQGIYNYEGWKKINAETIEKLHDLLSQLTDSDSVKIRIYEWESGLD